MAKLIDRARSSSVRYQPKAPDASVERVRELAGVITLSSPLPHRDMRDEDDQSSDDRASD